MVRRKGRPRRSAEARKQGPDRKSLVKYVDMRTCGANNTGHLLNALDGSTGAEHRAESSQVCYKSHAFRPAFRP